MAVTDVVFRGLYFAVGYTVSVSVCGIDCGDYVVSFAVGEENEGFITVPINSDPNGLFNGAYLAQFDVGPFDRTTYGDATTRIDLADGVGGVETIYVPVVIGFTYPSIGVGLRPLTSEQTKSPLGGAEGKTRRIQWAGFLFQNAQGVTVISSNPTDGFFPSVFTDVTEAPLNMNELFSGIYQTPVDDAYSYDGQLGWMVTRPYACTVVAMTSHLETQER